MSDVVYWLVLAVGLALVAAVGWDALVRGRQGPARVLALVALILLVVSGVLAASDVQPWALLALVLGGVLVAASRSTRRRASRVDQIP